jgi:ribonuclease BN (tRNA processing enzyme)
MNKKGHTLQPHTPYTPPYRIEDCKSVELPNPSKWRLQGHSKAGERTGFWLEPLNVVLDAGMVTHRVPKCVFLTHSHIDHCDCIHKIYNVTTQPAKGQNGLVGRLLVLPEYSVPLIKKHLEGIREKSRGYLDVCKKIEDALIQSKKVDPEQFSDGKGIVWSMEKTHPYIAKPGMRIDDLPGFDNLLVEVVEGYHSIPSYGYGFNIVTQKLKKEYHGLPGKEIAKLRKDGVQITEEICRPELIFYGDTTAKTLLVDSDWKKYPVIVIECTIYEPEDVVKQERLEEHIAWFQIEDVIKSNLDNYFVFIHSSEAVDDQFLKDFEEGKKKELGISNFMIFTDS